MTADKSKWIVDPVQKSMGQLGPWHLVVCVLIFLLKFPTAWHQLGIVFLAPPVNYTCRNISLDRCSDECHEWDYDTSTFSRTIITEWDLVCTKSNLVNLSQTIFMFGILIGSMLFGTLADKYGRRRPLVVAVIVQLLAGTATSFAPGFWLFVFLRFVLAVATGGTMVTSFVLLMEIVGPKWRDEVSVLYHIPFNVGHLSLAAFGYYFRDWRYLQFAVSIPSIVLASYYWLLPESPRYLFTSGKISEAVDVLTSAAKRNKLPTATIRKDLEEYAVARNQHVEDIQKGRFVDLFRTPNMRFKSICVCMNWFICGFTFFGVALYVGHIGGNIFLNVALGGALEVVGTCICLYVMIRFGRKKTLISANILTGTSVFLIAFTPHDAAQVHVTLASIGLIGLSIAFATNYQFAAELFPTVVRNIGVGTASMLARIGSMIAPFIVGLANQNFSIPPIIFGIGPLLGAILVCFMPETQGFPLPETLEDGEAFGRQKPKPKQENEMEKGHGKEKH